MKRILLAIVVGMTLAGSAAAGYYKDSWGNGTYKGDQGTGWNATSTTYASNETCGGSSGCGRLHCVEPITRMACTDQYCFYPPAGAISQAECCKDFGNVGEPQTQDDP